VFRGLYLVALPLGYVLAPGTLRVPGYPKALLPTAREDA